MNKKIAQCANDVIGKKIVSIYSCCNPNTAADIVCIHIETEDTILVIGSYEDMYVCPIRDEICQKNNGKIRYYFEKDKQ